MPRPLRWILGLVVAAGCCWGERRGMLIPSAIGSQAARCQCSYARRWVNGTAFDPDCFSRHRVAGEQFGVQQGKAGVTKPD